MNQPPVLDQLTQLTSARAAGRSWNEEMQNWDPVGCMQFRLRHHLSTFERWLSVRLVCSDGGFNGSAVQWSVGVSISRAQLAAR